MAALKTIEVTRTDGSTHIVKDVDTVEMENALSAYRDGQLLYMILPGEWETWRVVPPAPAWHDFPTTHGVWVRDLGDYDGFDAVELDAVYDANEYPARRWYGPIPKEL